MSRFFRPFPERTRVARAVAASGGGGGSSDWADVFVTHANVGPGLATDGVIVGLRGTSVSDYGSRVTVGNGGAIDRITNDSFDGAEDSLKLTPPDTILGGSGNAEYVGICNGTDLSDSGNNSILQMNFGFCYYVGSRFIDLAAQPKMTGFLMAASPGAATDSRAAIFEGRYSGYRIMGATANTVQSYHEPEDGYSPASGDANNELARWTTTASHAATPPTIGQEWVYIEQEVDCRRTRGNADGRNRIYIWTRDGVLSGRYLDIPLTWDGGWSFTNNAYIEVFEYLGGYWNDAGTANADSFCKYSHVKYSANRAVGDYMGPPPGFL